MNYNKSLEELERIQEQICRKYNAGFHKLDLTKLVGVADTVYYSTRPLNGLRHPLTDDTSGWYIWAGEYSSHKSFFKPVHVKHLLETSPEIMPYLGLPPGWRFLIDPKNDHEDVWRDDSLLLQG